MTNIEIFAWIIIIMLGGAFITSLLLLSKKPKYKQKKYDK